MSRVPVPGRWLQEEWRGEVRHALSVREWLHDETTPFQRIQIADTAAYGRVLALDGVFQTAERDEHYYHEMLVHPALTTAPRVERVLIVGGGDGGTLREVLRHDGVREAVMVEIDRRVIELSREHLPGIACAFGDPRLSLVVADGVRHVATTPASAFDVVVLDGSDPVGPSRGLFDETFYRDCARVLRPDGVFALQSESYHLTTALWHEMQHALGAAFARVRPYFGFAPLYGTGMWTWTHCSRSVDPLAIVDARAEPVEAHTRYYCRATHRAAFALPNEIGRAGPARPVF